MRISVKLLATLRDKLPPGTPGNACQMEVPAGCSSLEVLALFDIPDDNTNVILVNGHTPAEGYILQEGDTLCAFPAIAGG